MIKITSLTMKNFLSVGAVTLALDLDKHGLTLVLGANLDTNNGITQNGAGKTAVIQALSFALYGKPLSKIKIPNLVNNINNKQMMVSVTFERDGVTYKIERGRKPDLMRFFINNNELKDEDDIGNQQGENRHTQEEIERIVGMSHTMFKHIVALNTYSEPFLRMSVSSQREVIEELLGVMQISQRAEVLKKLIGQTREGMRDEQARIKAILEANGRIELAITNTHVLSNTWESKHVQTLLDFTEEIGAMEEFDYEAEIGKFDELDAWLAMERDYTQLLRTCSVEIGSLQREIKALEMDVLRYEAEASADHSVQIKRLETERTRKLRDVAELQEQAASTRVEIDKLNSDIALSGKLECFCCGQELAGTDHLETVLTKMHKNVVSFEAKLLDFHTREQEITAEAEHIVVEIGAIVTTAETVKAERLGIAAAKRIEMVAPTKRLNELLHEQETILENYKAAALPKPTLRFPSRDEVYKTKQRFDALVRELEVERALSNPYQVQAESFKSTLQEVNYDALNDLDTLFKHQDFLLKLLTNKDSFIRKKIIDQNLNYLNSRMNTYLEKLGLPHEVKFLSDLSVEILHLGRDFDFEQLSRGEMNRVIMATSWSFRDVWESLNESFNLLFIDELLDSGMDAQGVEAALVILKGMARDRQKNVFLISHRDDLAARIDRILFVRKEGGFTRFEEDASV